MSQSFTSMDARTQLRVTVYKSKTYYIDPDIEDPISYINSHKDELISNTETWIETEQLKNAPTYPEPQGDPSY